MAKKEEKKSIQDVIKELEKSYGAGSVIHGDKIDNSTKVIPTGSLGLDIALGIGGIPLAKIIEIYGWESSGKSTLAQSIVANAQKMGLTCLYIDGENSLEKEYSEALNVDLSELYIIQLDESAGEGAYNKMERLIETGDIDLVIIDSYNSLQPKSVVDGEVGESAIGKHARMLGQVVMKANQACAKYGTTFLFLGQLREKIGVLYGSPECTQGGNSLRFYSHIRLKVTRSTTNANSIMDGDIKLGNKTTVRVEKNKLSAPFLSAEFNIIYKKGIDKIGELIEIAKNYEVIKVWGKKTTYNEVEYVTDEFPSLLESNQELFEEIRSKILEKLTLNVESE